MNRHLPVVTLLASLALWGCGPQPERGGADPAEEAPAVATPVPATIAKPQVTAQLRGFAGHDANRDGFVTSAENAAAADKIFRAIDVNGDGTITAAELNAARVALGLVMLPGSEQLIADADQDNDAKLTLAEWIAQAGKDFAAADTNRDDKLSVIEWNAMPHLEPVAMPSAAKPSSEAPKP